MTFPWLQAECGLEQSAKGMAGKSNWDKIGKIQSGYRDPDNLHHNLSEYALYDCKLNTLSSFKSCPIPSNPGHRFLRAV